MIKASKKYAVSMSLEAYKRVQAHARENGLPMRQVLEQAVAGPLGLPKPMGTPEPVRRLALSRGLYMRLVERAEKNGTSPGYEGRQILQAVLEATCS